MKIFITPEGGKRINLVECQIEGTTDELNRFGKFIMEGARLMSLDPELCAVLNQRCLDTLTKSGVRGTVIVYKETK